MAGGLVGCRPVPHPTPPRPFPTPHPGERAAADQRPRAAEGSADPPAAPTCIRWWAEARFRNYGYDHWVHVHSGCNVDAVCAVSTNVRREPIEVRVAPGRTVEVLTFRGSPAREFAARVDCAFEA